MYCVDKVTIKFTTKCGDDGEVIVPVVVAVGRGLFLKGSFSTGVSKVSQQGPNTER